MGRFQKYRLAGKPISNQLNQYIRTLTSPSSSFFFSGVEKLLSEVRSSCKIIFNIHPFQFSQQLVLLFWTFCFPFKLHLSIWWKRFSCTSITALIHLRDTNMDLIPCKDSQCPRTEGAANFGAIKGIIEWSWWAWQDPRSMLPSLPLPQGSGKSFSRHSQLCPSFKCPG